MITTGLGIVRPPENRQQKDEEEKRDESSTVPILDAPMSRIVAPLSDYIFVLHGYCTIELFKKISGSNKWPHTIQWEVCGNVLVDEDNFKVLSPYRWLKMDDPKKVSYYAYRVEKKNRKTINILLAREVLGLSRTPGYKGDIGDHKNHDTREDTKENLRIVNKSQSTVNGVKYGLKQRFKGAHKNGNGYTACISVNGLSVYFSSVIFDTEAALLYNYTANLVYGEFAYFNVIPEDEMPTVERQWELYEMALAKLRDIGIQV